MKISENLNSLEAKTSPPTSRFIIMLMAATAGISVANIYYNQPILKEIGNYFRTTESQAGLISMLSQIGYGLGLFFITPLGDKLNKKKLIIGLEVLLIIVLTLIFFANQISQMWVLSFLTGLTAVSVQVIMPMAAGLDSNRRGKNLGTIFTGVLIGILSARVFSGAMAEWLGWKYVYLASALALVNVTVLLYLFLPDVPNNYSGNYRELLTSALKQVKRFSLLRSTALIGAIQFGMFCSFWTTLTFYLSGDPFHYHTDTIGLFGLVAIAGASLAPFLGKKTDKGKTRQIRYISISMILASIMALMLFPHSLMAIVMAVLFLDLGIQAMQITNVTLIYSLDATFHSRINTIFMTSVFIGGAAGTFTGLICWQHWGWSGVTFQMFFLALCMLGIILKEKTRK